MNLLREEGLARSKVIREFEKGGPGTKARNGRNGRSGKLSHSSDVIGNVDLEVFVCVAPPIVGVCSMAVLLW